MELGPGIEPSPRCGDSLLGRDFNDVFGEPEMPKAVRISAAVSAPTISTASADNSFFGVALFSGVGLLISLVAIIMDVQGVWY